MPEFKWPPLRNEPRPAFDVAGWQSRLDAIWGRNPYGGPMLRLMWMPERQEFYKETRFPYYTCGAVRKTIGWDLPIRNEQGEVVKIIRCPPYDKQPHPQALEVIRWERTAPPRWCLERWMGPTVAMGGSLAYWEQHRWEHHYDERIGVYRQFDMWGEPPVKGDYFDTEHIICAHSAGRVCCAQRKAEGFFCYGSFREPADIDLEWAAMWHKSLLAQKFVHSYDEMPNTAAARAVAEQCVRDCLSRRDAMEQKEAAELRYRMKHFLAPHSKRITTDGGGRLDKTKYHISSTATGARNLWKEPSPPDDKERHA